MNLNNKYIYIPLITISLTIIALWILFQKDFIKLISQISSLGTPVIAYFSWRAYTTVFKTKASEVQFNRVVNLISELKKIKVIINSSKNNEKATFSEPPGLFEFWTEYYQKEKKSKNQIYRITAGGTELDEEIKQTGDIYKVEKTLGRFNWLEIYKLRHYYYDPIIPSNIRKQLKQIKNLKDEHKKPLDQQDYTDLLNIVDEINNWFKEKGLTDYTLNDSDR